MTANNQLGSFALSWRIAIGLLLVFSRINAHAGDITLAAAYEAALARSEELAVKSAEWQAAECRYRQALGGMWPEISAVAAGDAQEGSEGYRAGAGVSWQVFNGFRSSREARAREADALAVKHDTAHLRVLLYQDVADVFYQALSFDGQASAAREQLGSLEDRAAELERRLKLGRVKRADLLSTSNQIAEVRIAICQLEQSQAASIELLAFLTGKPAAELHPVETAPLPAVADVDRYLALVAARPDVKAGEARVKAAKNDAKAAGSDRLPQVSLDGNAYAWRDSGEDPDWDLVLKAELPLFDRGVRSSGVEESRHMLRASELTLAALKRSSERDVRQAWQEVSHGFRQWAELQAAVAVAAQTLDVLKNDYELGRASNLDVLSAQAQLWTFKRRTAAMACVLRAGMIHLHVAAGETGQ